MTSTDKSADDLAWLMRWYLAQCDGEWEHLHGLSIETLDNPGWRLSVDLRGTALEGRPFEPVSSNLEATKGKICDDHWYDCEVQDFSFQAAAGPLDLSTVLRIFREWSERQISS